MKSFQSFQDSITLLSGGRVYRSARPGEQFDSPTSEHSKPERIQRVMLAQSTRILFAVAILILIL
jgi:hypothetical protein